LTAEQLEASRAERMRQNGHGALTLEDAKTWIEETGLCLFLPRRQFSSSIAPSFVEAVAGHQNATPDPKHIQLAEELLVRLELDDVAVRLNLLGQPGEQPDFVVASWVLPYVYALRGDRDWRRSPQLTGSRQVSQLAVQAYKHLEAGEPTIAELKQSLGREVTETAVLRAITELWQQLRIIPVISAPGVPAKWQLLRQRFQKAIAEGASTSQVTAISVLASIYLQAVIAASMEEVELFLAPLTARSKVREVLRGLVATRQVHTINLGHAPHFYVAGTLPEFEVPPTLYSSSSMPASAYFLRSRDHEDELPEFEPSKPAPATFAAAPAPLEPRLEPRKEASKPAESHAPRVAPVRKPASNGKSAAARPHFSRPASHSRDRKPSQSASGSRPARRASSDSRSASARPSSSRSATGSRPTAGARWSPKPAADAKAKHNGNGTHNGNGSSNGSRAASHGTANGSHGAGNGTRSTTNGARGVSNGAHSNASPRNGSKPRPTNGAPRARSTKSSSPTWAKRNGHSNGAKPAGKSTASARGGSLSRNGSSPRNEARQDARPVRGSRKPALAAGAKAGNSKRYGFTARPSTSRTSSARPNKETKKRG
jgi:23S rRNA pseudouridine2605 synthase